MNKKEILGQLESISKSTFEHSEELVHFVSCKLAMSEQEWKQSFENLEKELFNFVLEKRIVSKLAPAKQYLLNTLERAERYCGKESEIAQQQITLTREQIEYREPYLLNLKLFKHEYLDKMDDIVDEFGKQIELNTKSKLDTFVNEFCYFSESVEWHSFLEAWDYTKRLQRLVTKLAGNRLMDCQNESKILYMTILKQIQEEGSSILESRFDIDSNWDLESLGVEIEERLIFNNTDKYDFISEYLPSFGLISMGLMGFKFLNSNYIKLSNPTVKSSKLLCAGIVAGGNFINRVWIIFDKVCRYEKRHPGQSSAKR